ncbi:MAG: helix-turn-helix domain-containing protein [Proteobacteria bacterium]|nr:helix-turn-helix transcriptional regulator [Desulfobulbaceae bacterium]MBU4152156.1 helix-turn-helix domain-containing protein [Pseudomonadota bacterium]
MTLRKILEKLKDQRYGPSFTEIADMAEVSRSTLYKWMDNEVTPSIQGLEKISAKYEIDLALLCEASGVEYRPLASGPTQPSQPNTLPSSLPSLTGKMTASQGVEQELAREDMASKEECTIVKELDEARGGQSQTVPDGVASIIHNIHITYAEMSETEVENSVTYLESMSPDWPHKREAEASGELPGSVKRLLLVRKMAFADAGIPKESGAGVLLKNGAEIQRAYQEGKLNDKDIYDLYLARAKKGLEFCRITAANNAKRESELTKK